MRKYLSIWGIAKMKKKIIILCLFIIALLIGCNHSDEKTTIDNEAVETMGSEKKLELPTELLQKGDENESVEVLQTYLQQIGYPIEVNGTFDELTTWAITDLQLQAGIDSTGVYDESMKKVIKDSTTVNPGEGLAMPEKPDEFTDIVENPYEVLVLVNKDYALPADYEPTDLIVPNVRFPFTEDDPKKQLRKVAANALEQLFAAAEKDGVLLFAQSGYRSYDRQVAIFAANVEKHGEEHANTYSARAGESEHQTGLVMDVTSQDVGFDLITDFGDTEEGIWLKDHAHEYGFIIRYPEGKESITKYQYEPWHLRYVGIKAATEIATNHLTLEEYLGVN